MASSSFDFDRALAYALSCVKQEGLSLKDQQMDVFDIKLGRTNAPLVDRSVVLVISSPCV